jgi:hypothetical protein
MDGGAKAGTPWIGAVYVEKLSGNKEFKITNLFLCSISSLASDACRKGSKGLWDMQQH